MEYIFPLLLLLIAVQLLLIQRRISDLEEKARMNEEHHWVTLQSLVSEQAETLIDNSYFRQWERKRSRKLAELEAKSKENGGKQ